MITDDERREVAKRLRNGGIARNSEEAYVLLLSRIGIRPQLPAASTYEDAMVRLANLIDRPTCEYVPIGDGRFGCSECGNTVRLDFDVPVTDETPMPFKHCPNCGAEVRR
ncbi:MAG: hypothetical protein ACLUPX_01850 [Atopobiaceae bacterium]